MKIKQYMYVLVSTIAIVASCAHASNRCNARAGICNHEHKCHEVYEQIGTKLYNCESTGEPTNIFEGIHCQRGRECHIK